MGRKKMCRRNRARFFRREHLAQAYQFLPAEPSRSISTATKTRSRGALRCGGPGRKGAGSQDPASNSHWHVSGRRSPSALCRCSWSHAIEAIPMCLRMTVRLSSRIGVTVHAENSPKLQHRHKARRKQCPYLRGENQKRMFCLSIAEV